MVKMETRAQVPVMSLTLHCMLVASETVEGPGRGTISKTFPTAEIA